MQRIRKLSNDLKEALIPKSDKSDPRRRPSYRGAQPVRTGDVRKTTNPSVGYPASSAVTSRSREARAEREQREREGHHQVVVKPGREQGIGGNSVAFPSSSSRPKTRTKAQEKPVPVPSVNHKQTASDGTYWDRDAGGTPPATSPYRYVLDPQAKPLPLPPGIDPARKPHRRCPYSPSRHFVMSQSTPDVSFPARMGTPDTNGRAPASLVDVDMSTSHSTHSQPGTPAWPPEGPATVKRQQRTPKSSIESLYRSPTDMKEFRAPATAANMKDAGHGHSRTASAPVTTDTCMSPHRREQPMDPNPKSKPLFGDEASLISSKASYHTALTTIDPQPSLPVQVRELPASRAVHVQSRGVRRAASCKAQIVYPSYVTGPLPPLPDQASAPAPDPTPIPQRQVQAHTPTRRQERAAPRMMKPPKGHDEVFYTMPRRRGSQEQHIEVSYITLREFAQMEGKKRHEDLNRELANWDGVDAAANAAPASSRSYGGTTRPLVVKKRSEMFGARGARPARQ